MPLFRSLDEIWFWDGLTAGSTLAVSCGYDVIPVALCWWSFAVGNKVVAVIRTGL